MTRSFERNLLELDRVFDFITSFGIQERLPDSVTGQISLAVEELFSNSVKYNLRSSGNIRISLKRRDDELRIIISDPGDHAFDIRTFPPPDTRLSAEDRSVGGLGIHLVRQVMDDVKCDYIDGQNIFTLTKDLRP